MFQIREMERPFDVPDHGLVCDMLWSDPDEVRSSFLNPLVMNGLSHPNHLDESIFIFRRIRSDFSFFDDIHVSVPNSPR